MQYSDVANNTGMMQRAEQYSKLGIGGITSDTTLKAIFNGLFNEANNIITIALMKADRSWKFDDANHTNFPIATIDLVSGQRDYTLPASTVSGNPSSLYRVNRIRILGTDNQYYKIDPLDNALDEDTDGGAPTAYRIIGNSTRLNPKPLTGYVTLTGGMEVQFQRGPDQFVVGDTTQQPAFIDAYHYLIPLYASAQYLLPDNSRLALQYFSGDPRRPAMFENGLNALVDDMSKRNDDVEGQMTFSSPGSGR